MMISHISRCLLKKVTVIRKTCICVDSLGCFSGFSYNTGTYERHDMYANYHQLISNEIIPRVKTLNQNDKNFLQFLVEKHLQNFRCGIKFCKWIKGTNTINDFEWVKIELKIKANKILSMIMSSRSFFITYIPHRLVFFYVYVNFLAKFDSK